MAIVRKDIEIDKGGVFNPLFVWKHEDGTPIDLSTYTGRMVIRRGRDRNSEVIWEGTTANGKFQLFANGQFRPLVSSIETDAFDFNWAYYDIKIESNTPGADRYMVGGNVKLNKTVI